MMQMKIARCVLPNSGIDMYFYDCLKVMTLYKDIEVVLLRGECTDCHAFWHTTSHSLITANEAIRTKFRNHIAKNSGEFCLSGTKTKRGEYGNELPA